MRRSLTPCAVQADRLAAESAAEQAAAAMDEAMAAEPAGLDLAAWKAEVAMKAGVRYDAFGVSTLPENMGLFHSSSLKLIPISPNASYLPRRFVQRSDAHVGVALNVAPRQHGVRDGGGVVGI